MISKNIFELNINPMYTTLVYDNGAFFQITKPNIVTNLATCRDGLHGWWKCQHQNRLGFYHSDNVNLERINNFFAAIHNKLKLKDEIIIIPSENPRFVVIELTDFWMENCTKMQIFSLLIRATTYVSDDHGTVGDCLAKYPLVHGNDAAKAIMHFLNGNTQTTYGNTDWDNPDKNGGSGFINKFRFASPEFINKCLIGGKKMFVPPKPICKMVTNDKIFN